MQHKWLKPALALLTLSALNLTPAHAEGLVSLIETGGRDPRSANRAAPFVELRHLDGRDREYSVPYVPESMPRHVAADFIANWKTYQDTLHWASDVGLNNSVTSTAPPIDSYWQNCLLQVPADLQILLSHRLLGTSWVKSEPGKVNLKPSNPIPAGASPPPDGVNGWRDDQLNLEGFTVPRVNRSRYCRYASLNLIPDSPFVFLPGARYCLFGCVSTPGYPNPVWINWGALTDRIQGVCSRANRDEIKLYHQANLQSVTRNLPLAIHWDGLTSRHGTRSGTSMAPFFANTSNIASVTRIAQKDPRFLPYVTGSLPIPLGGTLPDERPGREDLEALKRYLEPGTLAEQERQGAVGFVQAWQQLDAVSDSRPIYYWAFANSCGGFPISCTPLALSLPAPQLIVTPGGCTALAVRTGLTSITQMRYRWGVVSVPEGYVIPNTQGTPILRTDSE